MGTTYKGSLGEYSMIVGLRLHTRAPPTLNDGPSSIKIKLLQRGHREHIGDIYSVEKGHIFLYFRVESLGLSFHDMENKIEQRMENEMEASVPSDLSNLNEFPYSSMDT